MLSSLGMAFYMSVMALWMREKFGWEGREIGKFVSMMGVSLMVVQSIVLPKMLSLFSGSEPRLAQLSLLLTAAKLVCYGLAPSGWWMYIFHMVGAAGSCSAPVLQSLCSRCAAEAQQGLLNGFVNAASTLANVVGALIGSRVYAATLKGGLPEGSHLFMGAAIVCFASVSVALGANAERGASVKKVDQELPVEAYVRQVSSGSYARQHS